MVSRLDSCPECRRLAPATGRDAWKALEGWLASLEGHVPVPNTLHEAMRTLAAVVPSSRVSLVVPLPDRHLRVVASSDRDRMGDLLIELERYPELAVVQETNEPVFIPDVARSELMAPVLPLVTAGGVVGIIAVPGRLDTLPVILRLLSRDRPFSREDLLKARAAAHLLEHLVEEPRGGTPRGESWLDLCLRVVDVVLEVLADGRVRRVWGDAAAVFLKEPEEIVGARCHTLFDPGSGGSGCRNLQRVFESVLARPHTPVTAVTATRPPRPCRLWAARAPGILPGILVAVRAERPGERGIRLEDLPVAALLLEGDTVVEANPAAAGILGARPRDLAGSPAGRTLSLLDPRADRPPRVVRGSLPGGPRARELVLLLEGGRNPDAAAREQRLREALERQAEELERAQARAEELEALTSRFLASSAHELKTPLTVVQSYLEILSSDLAEGLSEEQLSFLQIAYRNVLRLKRLVEDLVELAALEGGRMHLQIERVPVEPVVEAVMEDMEPLGREAGLELGVELPPDLPDLRADALRVQQVLYNLLDNAIKYTDPGGTVTLSGRREGDSVVLEVRDTGIGIPDEQIHTVFDPFVRLPGNGRRTVGGAGLGLTISRRITSALGGRLTLTSTRGEGSVFSLHLPVWPASDHADEN